MRRADVFRLEEDFLDAEASRFKVRSETAVVLPKAASHVLEEGESTSGVANDSETIGPEVALVLGPELFPGDAVGLTREAAKDEIHCATPRCAVEGSEVSPNRRDVQGTVRHTRDQERGGSSFPLHVTDDASPWSSHSHGFSVLAAAGAQFDGVEGTKSHTHCTSTISNRTTHSGREDSIHESHTSCGRAPPNSVRPCSDRYVKPSAS